MVGPSAISAVVIANGAEFETALSYAVWDVALEKTSRGGRKSLPRQVDREQTNASRPQRG